jgi:hypothetical protein
VAEARRVVAVVLADKTALGFGRRAARYDQALTAANETYRNNQAERVRENGRDAAQWVLERR